MAAPFLLVLVIASGVAATASGDDDVPHIELPGTPTAGSEGLMDTMSTSGCGAFAGLIAATPNTTDVFQQRLAAAGGLTVFCPDDRAVAAFDGAFRALPASERVAVLLHHGAAGRHVRARLAGFHWVEVPTLAVADDGRRTVLVRDFHACDEVWVRPTWPRGGVATVTKTTVSSTGLVLHVIDAVLLREELPEDAGRCGGGGYLSYLHCRVSLWSVLLGWVAAAAVQIVAQIYRCRS